MLPTFAGRKRRSSQPRCRSLPLMQSTVRHEWHTSPLRTRSSNGDMVDATKLNWPIGQTYLQKLAPVNIMSTTIADAKYARTRYAVARGSAHSPNSS